MNGYPVCGELLICAENQQFATHSLPPSILYLLFVCSVVAVLLIGREQGATSNSDIAGMLCFIFLVSLAVYVTLDLNQPESGWIRVSQEPIERLLSALSK